MPRLFTADWSGMAEGEEADQGNTNLTQVTPGYFARMPNDPRLPGLALEREDPSSGSLSWDEDVPINLGEPAWVSLTASLTSPLTASAICCQLMDESGTPLSQALLMTSGQMRARDQTTTAWTSSGSELCPVDGTAWRVDLRVHQAQGNGRCRVYPDATVDAFWESPQYSLVNNVDTPPELGRWGLMATQPGGVVGWQLHEMSVWDEWPTPPGVVTGFGKVWDGSGWVDSTAQRVWDGSGWVDATGAKVWDGSGWVDA